MRTVEEFSEIVNRPIAAEHVKVHPYSKFTYISTDHAIEMLNEAFDYLWSFRTDIGEQKLDAKENAWNPCKKRFLTISPFLYLPHCCCSCGGSPLCICMDLRHPDGGYRISGC